MKYIKNFENKIFDTFENSEPKVGDYVICKDLSATNHSRNDYKLFSDFISKNAGLIVATGETREFFVSYESVPKILDILNYAFFRTNREIIKNLKYKVIEIENLKFSNIASFSRLEIIFFGSKNTVETYIKTKNNVDKYNI